MRKSVHYLSLFLTFGAALGAQEADKKPATVSGRVVNAKTGEPLRRANLTLRGSMPVQQGVASAPGAYAAVSAADGTFRIEAVEPGAYRLMAERQGFVQGMYGARARSRMGATITVAPGQELTGLEMKLVPQAVVTGRVLDDEGEPVFRAQVQAMQRRFINGRWQLASVMSFPSQDTGDYRLSALTPGRYYIAAMAMGQMMSGVRMPARPAGAGPEESLELTFYPDSLTSARARALDLEPGMEMTGIDIRLRKAPTVRVRGRVAGVGEERVRLMLAPKVMDGMFGMRGSGAMPGPDGRFEIAGVRPGAYWLMMSPLSGMMTVLAKVEIEVGQQDLENVVIEKTPPASLTGTMRIEGDGQSAQKEGGSAPSLSGLPVVIVPVEGMLYGLPPAQTKADGSFQFENLAPDRYRVRPVTAPRGTWLKGVRAGGANVLDEGFSLAPGAQAQVEVIFATGAGGIRGVVTNAEGDPAPGSVVTLTPEPPRDWRPDLWRMGPADQSGQFRFEGLAPGEYWLFAWEDLEPGSERDPELLKRVQSYGRKVTVRANELAETTTRVVPASAAPQQQ
jgi:hypothetical protein